MIRILLLLAALAGAHGARANTAAREHPPLPVVTGPVANSASSAAFGATGRQNQPLDLHRLGYVEQEYFIRGRARIFDWPNAGGTALVLAEGPYVTRILVRRPVDARRASGVVIVEPFNPSTGVDLPIMWAQSYMQFIADGHTWVGVTVKPNTVRALRRFDPVRYGALALANPRPAPACEARRINPLSGPATVDDESGLAWDILSQLGALLKSPVAAAVIGRPASYLYMTGQSQSAGYARTYATLFASGVAGTGNLPLYDGFLYAGSPPWQVPLHQCREDLPGGDSRLVTPAVGVPVIELFAQGDVGTNLSTRRSDSDAPPDLFRRYEVAGAPHVDTWEPRAFPASADVVRAGGRPVTDETPGCRPAQVAASNFRSRYVFNAAWRDLDAWVRHAVPPPRAPWLELNAGVTESNFDPATAFVPDEFGNAKGGVRSLDVDVPTVRWVGAKAGGFSCMFEGYTLPAAPEALRQRYPGPKDYARQVRVRAAELQAGRWLAPADAAEAIAAARSGPVR